MHQYKENTHHKYRSTSVFGLTIIHDLIASHNGDNARADISAGTVSMYNIHFQKRAPAQRYSAVIRDIHNKHNFFKRVNYRTFAMEQVELQCLSAIEH